MSYSLNFERDLHRALFRDYYKAYQGDTRSLRAWCFECRGKGFTGFSVKGRPRGWGSKVLGKFLRIQLWFGGYRVAVKELNFSCYVGEAILCVCIYIYIDISILVTLFKFLHSNRV